MTYAAFAAKAHDDSLDADLDPWILAAAVNPDERTGIFLVTVEYPEMLWVDPMTGRTTRTGGPVG